MKIFIFYNYSNIIVLYLGGLLKVVKQLENAEKNPKIIEQWIRDINELNRGKTSAFFYSK